VDTLVGVLGGDRSAVPLGAEQVAAEASDWSAGVSTGCLCALLLEATTAATVRTGRVGTGAMRIVG